MAQQQKQKVDILYNIFKTVKNTSNSWKQILARENVYLKKQGLYITEYFTTFQQNLSCF